MPSMGLLGAIGGAAQTELTDLQDQTKRERDVNDYEQRAKFAQTLQEQLMERKVQLAQQYPSYTHFVTDSVTGDTRGYTPYGQVATLSSGDPAQKQLYEATRDATVGQKAGQVAVDQARVGELSAQTGFLKAKTDKVNSAPTNKDKPMSAAAYKTTLMMGAQHRDPGAFAPISDFDKMKDPQAAEKQMVRRQAAIDAEKADMDQHGVHINEGLLQPPQEADGNDNEFMNAGNDNEDNLSSF